jgi:hypothetical protein
MFRKIAVAITLGLIVPLLIVGVVSAITIAVDGVKEAAWNGISGPPAQTPAGFPDGNELDIDDRYDMSWITYTNDASISAPWGHLYFLVETYATYDDLYPQLVPTIIICLNTDNQATGATAVGYCNNMSGIDRAIYADLRNRTVTVRSWNGTALVPVTMPAGGMRAVAWLDANADFIADLPYIEIGTDLQSLGITNTATCLSTMPAAIYYDNGMANPEDTVPNSGTFTIGCGGATAVTLNSLQAQPTTSPVLPVALVGVSAAALIGVVFLVRRKKTA